MAIGLTSLTPETGIAVGGSFVAIVGTGFRVPADPEHGETVAQTVRVTFGTTVSEVAYALSATEIMCIDPGYAGDADVDPIPVVDVLVENLADNGDVQDSATLSDAWMWTRPVLDATSDDPLPRLVRGVLRMLKRGILANTSLSTHPDFDDDVEDGLDITAVAELPALVLYGPTLREDKFLHSDENVYVQVGDVWQSHRIGSTVDLVFGLRMLASERFTLIALMGAVEQFFSRRRHVRMARSGADPEGASVQWSLVLETHPESRDQGERSLGSNVFWAECAFAVMGFDIESPFGSGSDVETVDVGVEKL